MNTDFLEKRFKDRGWDKTKSCNLKQFKGVLAIATVKYYVLCSFTNSVS